LVLVSLVLFAGSLAARQPASAPELAEVLRRVG
jgi:hypothetical protein